MNDDSGLPTSFFEVNQIVTRGLSISVPEQSQEFAVEPVPRPHGAEKVFRSKSHATQSKTHGGEETELVSSPPRPENTKQLGAQRHGIHDR